MDKGLYRLETTGKITEGRPMGRNCSFLCASERSRPFYQAAAFYEPFVLSTGGRAVCGSTYVLFDTSPRLDMPKHSLRLSLRLTALAFLFTSRKQYSLKSQGRSEAQRANEDWVLLRIRQPGVQASALRNSNPSTSSYPLLSLKFSRE